MTQHMDDLANKALSLANIGKWHFTLGEEIIYLSDVARAMLEIDNEKPLFHESIEKWIHPNDLKSYLIFKDNLESGKSGSMEVRFTLINGQVRILKLQGEPLFNGNKVVGHFGIIKDLTDVRKTEDNYNHIKDQLSGATSLLNFGCLDFNLDARTGTWIAPVPGLYGSKKSDTLTMSIESIICPVIPADRDILRNAIYATRYSGVLNCEYRFLLPNGEQRLMRVNGVLYDDHYVMAFTTDITEVRQLQLKTQEIEKTNMVANMSAAVSHEILNPLTSILGFIKLVDQKISDEEAKSFLEIIHQESLQIKEIASELLFLAKPQAIKYQMCNIKEVVESVLPLIRAQSNMNTVQLDCKLRNVSNIYAEPNHLRQVFVNIE